MKRWSLFAFFSWSVFVIFITACSAERTDTTVTTPVKDGVPGATSEEASFKSNLVFDIKNASQYFDIRVTVAACDATKCTGKAKFEFFRKNETDAYQMLELEDTYFDLFADGKPYVNRELASDKYSVVYTDDVNFDGNGGCFNL